MGLHEHLRFARAEWDRRAVKDPKWAAWAAGGSYAEGARRCYYAVLYETPVATDAKCLEIGCGAGRIMSILCQQVESIVGYDLSPVMAEHARGRLALDANCRVVISDGKRLTPHIAGAPLDFIYSVLCFQHNPPEVWQGLLRDAYEVAAEGATLRVQFKTGEVSATEVLSFPVTRDEAVAGLAGAGWQVTAEHMGLVHPEWLWVTGRKGQ